MCSGIANYCEISRKTRIFWRKGKLKLPLPFANSYDQSQLQPINPGRIPLHMQSTCEKCVYVLACATYEPSIS